MHNEQKFCDTTIDAELKYIQILGSLGIEGRANLTFELSDSMRKVLEDGIKHRHPAYDEKDIRLAVMKLTLPAEVFCQFFGKCGIEV
jgi:hypothetical protein